MAFQITASLLDACVLSMLSRGDTYGYELTQSLRERLQVSESTLYPVLRRLQGSGFLRTYDLPHQGRNRRYYAITDSGRAQLDAFRDDWKGFRGMIDGFLGK
ncbi:MAG: PadR family transcriptional regulator [Eggerthellaceae bacterium]|nr:PadR family transcriptional regulator [Eggerthellaceae bacterium]MDR2715994.1 PadR family transcriptional regulator [Coriobacteriaceae bacterium]